MRGRVLLLMPTTSYKAEGFLAAAERLGVEVVAGTDRRQALESQFPGTTMTLDPARLEEGVRRIVREHRRRPFRAVIGVDDETTVLAAAAAAAIQLPHNPVDAVRASRDKYETRRRARDAGMPTPWFFRAPTIAAPADIAPLARYPCVLKPLGLSASRGVIRADDPGSFEQAFARIVSILQRPDARRKGGDTQHLLVEGYLPGEEVSLEGLLSNGELCVLALFDKPDPLEGPTFEETLYVTPSRLPDAVQSSIGRCVADACRALGLCEGPVHAEIRVDGERCRLLEVASRTIGGLCSRALRFGVGVSLEEVVLRHALGEDLRALERETPAAGVMMIPIPRAGVLQEVHGLEHARSLPLVEEITLTALRGTRLAPPPEGDRYLGFIFARGAEPQAVEGALRAAHRCLRFDVE